MWWPEAGKEELNSIWSTARCCKEFQWKLVVREINFSKKTCWAVWQKGGWRYCTAHTDSRCLGEHWTTTAGSRKGYLEIKGRKANSMDNTHNMLVSLASGSRLTAALLISLQGWSTEYSRTNLRKLLSSTITFPISPCVSHTGSAVPWISLLEERLLQEGVVAVQLHWSKSKGAQDTKQG